VFRDIITVLFILLLCPFWISVVLFGYKGRNIRIFLTVGQALSLLPGVIGVFSRRAYYMMTLDSCARDVGIEFGTWFTKRQVKIAPKVSFGAHCLIGSCEIGEGTLFGSNVDLLSGRHQHASELQLTGRSVQTASFQQLVIGEQVWIGNRTVLMADVGEASVIGAGSVVVKSVPSYSLAVGNPATIKKTRNGNNS
jgi:virginiamycin A acetyltransferase